MSILAVNTRPLIARSKPYPPGVGSAPDAVLRQGGQAAQELAQALHNIEARMNMLDAVLRQQSTIVDKIAVVDKNGKVLAALGDFIFQGVPATNYFSELHAGDPLNTGDPSQALFNANTDGSVTIGQHGWLQVLDPYAADAAWIGTQFDTLPVIGAANNGAGLIRLQVTGHTLLTGDVAQVRGVVGVTSATNGTSNANGTFTVTKIDANHLDLQSSVFVGSYTSGGTVDRLLHIAGVADNGSGLARIQTAVAHTYESGDTVNLQGVGSGLNTQWIIEVIDSTHFDLVGSTFTGGTNGTSLRYFAGGLFQTIAIGPSFADYRLRAFRDGSLKIRDAEIILNGSGATIDIDPTTGTITITQTGPDPRNQTVISGTGFNMSQVGVGASTIQTSIGPGTIAVIEDSPNSYGIILNGLLSIFAPSGSLALANQVQLYAYSGATGFGPMVSCTQYRGTGAAPTPTQSGDTLGGIIGWGFDGTGESQYPAGISMIAAETHTITNHGTKIIFEVTATGGSTVPTIAATISQTGLSVTSDINTGGVFRVSGVAGMSVSRSFGTSLTVNSVANGVVGTPGAGQANAVQVTGVTLNLTANGFSGGILTS